MKSLQLYFFGLLSLTLGFANAALSPSQYDLQLYLDTSNDVFVGYIDIKALAPAGSESVLSLHNDGLNISLMTVKQNGVDIYLSSSTDATAQITTVQLSARLIAGAPLVISISYQGLATTQPTGLYYFTDNGNKIYMTNFYPTHARKVFPCIDEPGSPAIFNVSISYPTSSAKFIASSNITSTTQTGGVTINQLAPTPLIAPYSLFFTLGSWTNTYKIGSKKTELWLYPSLSSNVNVINPYINQIANNTYLEAFMDLQTSTLNVFIVPSLMRMSYSGLKSVVLKTDIALIDLTQSTTLSERDNFVAMAYAFRKVLFGTNMRPADWSQNWLSDSISTYLAYQALSEIKTYGSADDAWLTTIDDYVFAHAWASDSSAVIPSAIPTDPTAIHEFLEGVSMKKGAFALKSLETMNNFESLDQLLYTILLDNFGQTMNTTYFVSALGKYMAPVITIKDKTLSDIVTPMMTEPGFPIVVMNRNEQTVTMTKSTFTYPTATSNVQSPSDWLLPTTALVPPNPNASIYYFDPSSNGPISAQGTYSANTSIAMDVNGRSLMRTSYDSVSYNALKMNAFQFSPSTRTKLVMDAFVAAEANYQTWFNVLNFLEYLKNETELAPWTAALSGFRRMWSWIYHTGQANKDPQQLDLTGPFLTYMKNITSVIYEKLGTTGANGDAQNPLRSMIVNAVCELGNTSCIGDLGAQYQKMAAGTLTPSNDMYAVVLCVGLRSLNTTASWQAAFQKYVTTPSWTSQTLKNSHYHSLACPHNNETVNQFLTIISSTFTPDQLVAAFGEIVSQPQNVDAVVSFIVKNGMKFSSNVSVDQQLAIVKKLGQHLTATSQITALQNFTKSNSQLDPSVKAAFETAITGSQSKLQWIISYQNAIYDGLTNKSVLPPNPGNQTNPPSNVTTPAPKHSSAANMAISFVALICSLFLITFY